MAGQEGRRTTASDVHAGTQPGSFRAFGELQEKWACCAEPRTNKTVVRASELKLAEPAFSKALEFSARSSLLASVSSIFFSSTFFGSCVVRVVKPEVA